MSAINVFYHLFHNFSFTLICTVANMSMNESLKNTLALNSSVFTRSKSPSPTNVRTSMKQKPIFVDQCQESRDKIILYGQRLRTGWLRFFSDGWTFFFLFFFSFLFILGGDRRLSRPRRRCVTSPRNNARSRTGEKVKRAKWSAINNEREVVTGVFGACVRPNPRK